MYFSRNSKLFCFIFIEHTVVEQKNEKHKFIWIILFIITNLLVGMKYLPCVIIGMRILLRSVFFSFNCTQSLYFFIYLNINTKLKLKLMFNNLNYLILTNLNEAIKLLNNLYFWLIILNCFPMFLIRFHLIIVSSYFNKIVT